MREETKQNFFAEQILFLGKLFLLEETQHDLPLHKSNLFEKPTS